MAIKIGKFVLHHPTEGKIWINRQDAGTADGGQFDANELEMLLEDFYARRF